MEKNKLDFQDIALDEKHFERIEDGQLSNEYLAELCDTLAEFNDDDGLSARRWSLRADDLRYCHKAMFWNHFKSQQIKDFQRTFKCHDRFCPLCAKDVANRREQKFAQALEDISSDYDLFHLSMTLPNCRGDIAPWTLNAKLQNMKGLTERIKQMQKCFKKLVQYLYCKEKIKGINFAQYGYAGAIRSMEITFQEHQEYHPHYHVILALKKGIELPGEHENKYSYDKYTKAYHYFTDFEILIQNIWFMILNDIKVVKSIKEVKDEDARKQIAATNAELGFKRHLHQIDQPVTLDNIKLGYSCHMRRVEKSDCHEVFKYVVKPDEGQIMNIAVLQDLDSALYKKRSVETYGLFRKYKFSDEEIDESFDKFYDALVEAWHSIETPTKISESASEARENIKQQNCIYVSRKSIRCYMRKLGLDEELPAIVAEPVRIKEYIQVVMDLPEVKKKIKKSMDLDERRARSKGVK